MWQVPCSPLLRGGGGPLTVCSQSQRPTVAGAALLPVWATPRGLGWTESLHGEVCPFVEGLRWSYKWSSSPGLFENLVLGMRLIIYGHSLVPRPVQKIIFRISLGMRLIYPFPLHKRVGLDTKWGFSLLHVYLACTWPFPHSFSLFPSSLLV